MNINSINVSKNPVSQLFDTDSKVTFVIPKYQREYTWSSAHWETLFDDLMENESGYFLGSIICINSSTDSIGSPKFDVIDGQQRLTTISLLLAAIYSILNTYESSLDKFQQHEIFQIMCKLILKGTKERIRVVPQTQGSNRADYIALLNEIGIVQQLHPRPKNMGRRRIEKAYKYFIIRINSMLAQKQDEAGKIAEIFSILDKINSALIVKIEVSNHADAYTLFESLNNRGAPLTAVDLIKNMLLTRLDTGEAHSIDEYFVTWTNILSNLGEEYSDQERFFRQNYNAFKKELNAPFLKNDRQSPLGQIATRSTMLDIYEKIISNNPGETLEKLSVNSAIYGEICLNRTEQLNEAQIDSYQDLQRVQGAPSYLLVMYLIKNRDALKIDEQDVNKICGLLVNFFIRRNLTDTPPTRDLTRFFMKFIDEIEKNAVQGAEIYSNLHNAIRGISASDELFREVLEGPVYDDNSGATRFILCMLAKRGMTRENMQDLWRKNNNNQYVWSIEHIFPQGENIPAPWVNMIADGDLEKAREYQSEFVHTLGNLTLTGYNSSLSNKSFEEKKERSDKEGKHIGYNNGFNLNDDVYTQDKWTIDVIQARTKRMVKEVMEMFKL